LTDRQRVKRSNVLEAPPKKVSPDSPPNNHLTMYSRIKITTKTHSAYGKTSKGDSWRLELLDPLTGARAAGSRDGCGVKCRYSDYLYIKKKAEPLAWFSRFICLICTIHISTWCINPESLGQYRSKSDAAQPHQHCFEGQDVRSDSQLGGLNKMGQEAIGAEMEPVTWNE